MTLLSHISYPNILIIKEYSFLISSDYGISKIHQQFCLKLASQWKKSTIMLKKAQILFPILGVLEYSRSK